MLDGRRAGLLPVEGKTLMRCERCHGLGQFVLASWEIAVPPLPCPECGGTGVTYCCDGAPSEQPAKTEEREVSEGSEGFDE